MKQEADVKGKVNVINSIQKKPIMWNEDVSKSKRSWHGYGVGSNKHYVMTQPYRGQSPLDCFGNGTLLSACLAHWDVSRK